MTTPFTQPPQPPAPAPSPKLSSGSRFAFPALIVAALVVLAGIVGAGLALRVQQSNLVAVTAPKPEPESGSEATLSESEKKLSPQSQKFLIELNTLTSKNDDVRCPAALKYLDEKRQEQWQKYGVQEDFNWDVYIQVYKCEAWLHRKSKGE